MSRPAILIEKLWKEYAIGGAQTAGRTFREALADTVRTPLRRFSQGRVATKDARFWALKDISFQVPSGEVIGIIGRNGAGKSTLLKILSRITAPTRGTIQISGRIASLLEVGTGFHPELTGRENIRLNAAILGMTSREILGRFDEIVAFAGVEKFIDMPVKRYSSGMQMRLAFAVAAHLVPDILIVDEVLAVGDAEFQKKCINRMSQLSGSGRTILFVSHNLGAIKHLCGSAIYLRAGELQAIGLVDDVADRYIKETMEHRERDGALDRLSRELDLVSLSVNGGSIESFAAAAFSITLRARNTLVLLDLAILIERESGERAATIDCRDATFPKRMSEGCEITVGGQVESLNLVEGPYVLSVYHRTYSDFGITQDVGDLVVSESMSQQLHPPYRAQNRGSVALKLRFDGDDRVVIS